jgi:hypothetical protein
LVEGIGVTILEFKHSRVWTWGGRGILSILYLPSKTPHTTLKEKNWIEWKVNNKLLISTSGLRQTNRKKNLTYNILHKTNQQMKNEKMN